MHSGRRFERDNMHGECMETYASEGPTEIHKSQISLSTTSSTAQPAHLEIHAGLSTRVLSGHFAKRYTYTYKNFCHVITVTLRGFILKGLSLLSFQ